MSSKDAHDQQYEILANEILHFVWKPGDLISESSLCQRFSLSRTPVRAILQRLQENGLVRIEPKKGSIVTPLSIETISQLIFERMAVETMVLRDYIRICNPSDVERVRYLYSCLCAVGETYQNPNVPFEASTFMHADLSMHAEWFRRTSKPLLWKRLSSPQSSYTRFCMLDLRWVRAHRLTAFSVGDAVNDLPTLMNNRELCKSIFPLHHVRIDNDCTGRENLAYGISFLAHLDHCILKNCDTVDSHSGYDVVNVLRINRSAQVTLYKVKSVDLTGCSQQFWLIISDLCLGICHNLKITDNRCAIEFSIRAVELNHRLLLPLSLCSE